MREVTTSSKTENLRLPFLFIVGRFLIFLALIPDDLHGFGDLPQYFKIAGLEGLPYFDYWVEYPPLFPFLNSAIYYLASGQQFLYEFLVVMTFSIAGGAGIYVFHQIGCSLYGEREGFIRTVIYFALLAPLPYTWWYYDLIPVLFMLLGVLWILKHEDQKGGLAISLGMLAKWFPGLLLPAIWRYRPTKQAIRITGIALVLLLTVFIGLYLASPEMTSASLISQPSRTSWQTIWALIDGNYTTGEFIILSERLDPLLAGIPRGNPARISTGLTLLLFLGVGSWFFLRVRNFNHRSLLSFLGITWAIFLIWSPGWSPQWVLYLIPLILLTLPYEKGMFWSILLLLITILEWPVLLKRNLYSVLWIIAPARILLFCFLIFTWYKQTQLHSEEESL